jgi:hypothetical protein
MSGYVDLFIQAIHGRKRLLVTFYSKEDFKNLVRNCAPMDYGPSRRAKDKSNRFHFWDYDSDTRNHTLSLLPEQIVDIVELPIEFDPIGFVTWNTAGSPWFIPRDWGKVS